MTGSTPKRLSDLDLIAEEHERLKELIRALQGAADARAGAAVLEKLMPLLLGHFEHEEAPDGLYESIAHAAPRYHHVLERLSQQHGELLTAARALSEKVGSEGADWAALAAETSAFVELLLSHEQQETELLNDSLLLDLGHSE
jgi:hypothetical protein